MDPDRLEGSRYPSPCPSHCLFPGMWPISSLGPEQPGGWAQVTSREGQSRRQARAFFTVLTFQTPRRAIFSLYTGSLEKALSFYVSVAK